MEEVFYKRGCEKLSFEEAMLEGWRTGGSINSAGTSEINKQVFFQRTDQPTPIGSSSEDSKLSRWLREEMPTAGSLRLLISRWPPDMPLVRSRSSVRDRMLVTIDNFRSILDEMRLPLAYPLHYCTSNFVAKGFDKSGWEESMSLPFTAIFQTPAQAKTFFSLVLSYNIQTKNTNAYLIGTEGNGLDLLLARLETAISQASHPMLLPVLLYMMYSEVLHEENKRLVDNVRQIQISTGLMDPRWVYARKNGGMSNLDLAAVHKRIATSQERVTSIQRSCMREFGVCIAESFSALEAHDYVNRKIHVSLKSSFADLRRISLVEIVTEGLCQEKLNFQHKVLYNLMQQQDSNISQEIAIDSKKIAESSKRDSSAMKSIAALTMVFLPGTAVATIFSMGQFFTIQEGKIHANSSFWLFWAVSIPLTGVVMIIWLLVTWYSHGLRDKKLLQIEMGSGFQEGEKRNVQETIKPVLSLP